MTISEYRAKVFMEMMAAKPHSALERSKADELRCIDRVILGSKEIHENLVATEYGYLVSK